MARKRKIQQHVDAKGDTFHVMLNGIELTARGMAMHAVNVAQTRAANVYKEPVELTIVRRSLFGPEATLYRVTRDEQGVVWTTPVSVED